jgi:hypothetical protein
MITVNLAQLKSDIAGMLKGTSIREVKNFYDVAASAANRMTGRIDTNETIRTATLATPFWDNVNDYPLMSDYKRMLDIRPQANRTDQPGDSMYSETSPREFASTLTPDSYSIRWNNMVRTLRAQVLPSGNVAVMDPFDGPSSNGLWTGEGDVSNLYTEPLNYVQGNGSLGFDLSGATGAGDIVNSTAAVLDLSTYRYEDASMLYVWIPLGKSSRFTSFALRRGSDASNYVETLVNMKADGTPFTDGWNFLLFNWSNTVTTGTPDNTKNTYRRFGVNYQTGTPITGFLVDSWTNALGNLYEAEYYSEYLFRTAAGVWIQKPTLDTDLVNVGTLSYEILKAEMMVTITQNIRLGAVREQELTDWRLMLNGQPQTRYVKDPPYHRARLLHGQRIMNLTYKTYESR